MTQEAGKAYKSPEAHELKTWPEYFQQIVDGKKTFEIRKNDRGFKVGELLRLIEWEPEGWSSVSPNERIGHETGRRLEVRISYLLSDAQAFGLMSGYVIMGIETPTPESQWPTEEAVKSESRIKYPLRELPEWAKDDEEMQKNLQWSNDILLGKRIGFEACAQWLQTSAGTREAELEKCLGELIGIAENSSGIDFETEKLIAKAKSLLNPDK